VIDHADANRVPDHRPLRTHWLTSSALPYLAHAAPERLRVVHRARHPVPTSLSDLAHSSRPSSGAY
jgi:hypothetical protein